MQVSGKARQVLVVWLARRLPPCEEVAPLMSAALDRRLTLRERLVLRLHHLVCAGCRRYLRQLLFIREAMHRHPDPLERDAQASLSPQARDRIRRMLSGE